MGCLSKPDTVSSTANHAPSPSGFTISVKPHCVRVDATAGEPVVESTIGYLKSGSSDIASKMDAKTRFTLHRLKRRNTFSSRRYLIDP
jgi:hypothetical protein